MPVARRRVASALDPALRLTTVADGGRAILRRITIATAVSDAACILTASLAAYQIRFGLGRLLVSADELAIVLAAPVVWVAVLSGFRMYATHRITAEEEFRRLAQAVTVGIAILVIVSYWSKADVSRLWLGVAWILLAVFEVVVRGIWRGVRTRASARGLIALRTLIVGANEEAATLGDALRASSLGYAPLGYVSPVGSVPSPNGLPVLGSLATLHRVVRVHGVHCLFVAASAVDAPTLCDIARFARRSGLELLISSRLPEVLSTRLSVQRMGAIAAISVMPPRLTRSQTILKRAFDLAVASTLLLLALPAMAAIAVVVRAGSPGPVLFRQVRVTTGGRAFRMLKFRTMTGRPGGDPSTPFHKHDDDQHVTGIGRVLRRWSLDELPQLINVIAGDMSLVGPRPLPIEQIEANTVLLGARHEVPAGMTGWWQVRGRSDRAPEEAVALDLFYVENWSLAYDLYVLLCTLGAVARGRGAR